MRVTRSPESGRKRCATSGTAESSREDFVERLGQRTDADELALTAERAPFRGIDVRFGQDAAIEPHLRGFPDPQARLPGLHQQLLFRPVPGTGRAETGIGDLYLASASAHPGGGVHGAPGMNAARAALAHDRTRRLLRRT